MEKVKNSLWSWFYRT